MDDKTLPLGFMTTKNCNDRRPIAMQRWSAVILTYALAACSTAKVFLPIHLAAVTAAWIYLRWLVGRMWVCGIRRTSPTSLSRWKIGNLSATCPRIGVRFQPTDYVLTSGMGLNTHKAQALSLTPRHHVLPVRHIFIVIQHLANDARGANDRAPLHEHYFDISLLWTNHQLADVV